MAKTNPNKANQHKPDPRQDAFLAYYFNPKSATFGDAKKSAIKANYTVEYAENILSLMPTWLSEVMEGRSSMFERAERNLSEVLDMQTVNEDGHNPQLLKIKTDISKFVAERVGRKIYGKSEESGGGNTVNNITQININVPNTRNPAQRETVPSVASPSES